MNDRHSRQGFLGARGIRAIDKVVVGIIGLGGGGSHIVQQLAHLGVQNFIIADYDVVEGTNLNRLVGATQNDANERTPKTEVARRLISGLSPSAEITIINDKWQIENMTLRECDVIFGCVDSLGGREQLEQFTRRFLISYIDIGMDVLGGDGKYFIVGQVVRSIFNEPCLRCLGIIDTINVAEEATRYGAAGSNPQVVWSNGVLASLAIGLFVELLTQWHPTGRSVACLEYDGNNNTVEMSKRLEYVEDGKCPHYKTKDVGDPFFRLKT